MCHYKFDCCWPVLLVGNCFLLHHSLAEMHRDKFLLIEYRTYIADSSGNNLGILQVQIIIFIISNKSQVVSPWPITCRGKIGSHFINKIFASSIFLAGTRPIPISSKLFTSPEFISSLSSKNPKNHPRRKMIMGLMQNCSGKQEQG